VSTKPVAKLMADLSDISDSSDEEEAKNFSKGDLA